MAHHARNRDRTAERHGLSELDLRVGRAGIVLLRHGGAGRDEQASSRTARNMLPSIRLSSLDMPADALWRSRMARECRIARCNGQPPLQRADERPLHRQQLAVAHGKEFGGGGGRSSRRGRPARRCVRPAATSSSSTCCAPSARAASDRTAPPELAAEVRQD